MGNYVAYIYLNCFFLYIDLKPVEDHLNVFDQYLK